MNQISLEEIKKQAANREAEAEKEEIKIKAEPIPKEKPKPAIKNIASTEDAFLNEKPKPIIERLKPVIEEVANEKIKEEVVADEGPQAENEYTENEDEISSTDETEDKNPKKKRKKKLKVLLIVFSSILVLLIGGVTIFYLTNTCEHEFGEPKVIKAANCTEEGIEEVTCNLCGETEQHPIEKTAHSFTEKITKNATCVDEGERLKTCKVCGLEVKETIKVKDHTFEYKTVKESSCTEKGKKEQICKVCGATGKSEDLPLAEHSFTENITRSVTCTSDGLKTIKCSVCGKSETQNIPATGHNYVRTVELYNTCTTNGTYRYTCSNCGNSYTETIAASGHNWVDATCTTPKTCSTCGATEGQALGHVFSNGYCSRCGIDNSIEMNEELEKARKDYENECDNINATYDSRISVLEDTAEQIMMECGVYSLSSSSYYENRAYSVQSSLSNVSMRYAYATSASERAQYERQMNELREELRELYSLQRAAEAMEEVRAMGQSRKEELAIAKGNYDRIVENIKSKYN